MNGTFTIALAISLALTGSALALDHKPASHPAPARYAKDQVLVRFKDRTLVTSMAAAHAEVGAKEMRRFTHVDGLTLVKLRPGISVEDALKRYRKLPDVKYAVPNYIRRTAAVPNDPYFVNGSLWGLQNSGQGGGTPGVDIGATAAWDLTTGSRDVVVMVIDSGIDYNHPDLAANMWRNTADCNHNGIDDDGNGYVDDCYGINPAYNSSDPMDDTIDSHGTHVAGIIAAVGNNARGVVGVNWLGSLMACKAFDNLEEGSDADIIACLDYALTMKQRGINIVATNNSFGGADFDPALYDAIAAQMKRGILFIATAGDTAIDEDISNIAFYPANYDLPNIVSVAAINRFDKMWPYSGYGRHTVHLCAPGDIIYSTVRGTGYDFSSGTSEATAFVTGVAALLKAQDPNRDWRAIKNLILAGGADDAACSNAFQGTITGKRLNAYGSLTCQNSTVLSRLRPKGSGWTFENIPMGTMISLSALNINCAVPGGPINVTVQPGNVVIPLLDDGTGSDLAAGDGVYSAAWNPPHEGDYTLTFPDGSVWQAGVLPAYTYNVAPFSWITIDGTNLNLSDDSTGTIASPFPIVLGGASYSSVYVDSNGKLNFDNPYTDPDNISLVDPLSSTMQRYFNLVAAFWDDLLPIPNTAQNVFWAVTGGAPQRELVIEWRNVSRAGGCTDPTATINFEVVLSEGSSDIVVNYRHTTFGGAPDCAAGDQGAHATAGIMVKGPSAVQYGYDAPNLTDNLSLQYKLVQ